jgi:GTP-binding protein
MSQSCRIVIVGRPNVGKSTLFNRLIGRRRSLVHDEPGVTRDRIEEPAEWWVRGQSFPVQMVDTGGLGGERFADEIQKQVKLALKQADVVLFLFDSQVGLTPLDEELLLELNRSGVMTSHPVIGVVNKVDAEVHESRVMDFYSAGLDPVLTISAEHGRGIDDLQQVISEKFKEKFELSASSEVSQEEDQDFVEETQEFTEEMSDELSEETPSELEDEFEEDLDAAEEKASRPPRIPRIAIMGRPNVGKSTLLNAILGEDRMITSPIAGTTVDSIDSLVTLNGKQFLFVDTAGIRRKSKTEQGVEVLSVVQSRKTLEKADVALLVLDGELGISDQDEKIGGLIEEVGSSVVIVMNKWDTQRKNQGFTKELAAERIRGKMAYLKYAPIMFVSARRKEGFDDLGDLLEDILHQRSLKIPTHEFTEWLRKESTIHNPANAKFYLCHQAGRNPPTFVCHVNDPEKIHFSLKRHLVNALRERWGYMGTPIRLNFIEGKNRRSLPKKKPPVVKKLKKAGIG